MRQILGRVVALFTLALCPACSSGNNTGNSTGQPAIPADAVTLNVAYDNSAQAWLTTAIDAFNRSGAKNSDGKPLYVVGQPIASGAMVEAMATGTPTYDLVI